MGDSSLTNCIRVSVPSIDLNNDGFPDEIRAHYCQSPEAQCQILGLAQEGQKPKLSCSVTLSPNPMSILARLSSKDGQVSKEALGEDQDSTPQNPKLVTTYTHIGAAAKKGAPLFYPQEEVMLANGEKVQIFGLIFRLHENLLLKGITAYYFSDLGVHEVPLESLRKVFPPKI